MRLAALVCLTLALLFGVSCTALASTDRWGVGLLDAGRDPAAPSVAAGWGVLPGSIDGYDSADTATTLPLGFYRQNGSGWAGPTGFYGSDGRAPLTAGETKVWADLYLWFPGLTQPDVNRYWYYRPSVPDYDLPLGWLYTLYLDRVCDGVTYAGPYSWTLLPGGPSGFTIWLPRAPTPDAWHGYRFHFEAAPVPEPSSLAGLALAVTGLAAGAIRRRHR